MNKNRIIFIFSIIIILVMLMGASFAFSFFGKQPTKIAIGGNDTIKKGDDITVKLTDDKGTPIFNQTINITITGKDIKENKSVITNKKGYAKIKMDYGAGKYTVNCTFAGNEDIDSNFTVKKINIEEIEEEEVYDDSDYVDYGAFYSYQEGRTIYTGEVHEGPDGNWYEHLGNNEWVLIE